MGQTQVPGGQLLLLSFNHLLNTEALEALGSLFSVALYHAQNKRQNGLFAIPLYWKW